MTAPVFVDSITNVLLAILSAGAALRIIIALVKLISNPEEADQTKKRIKNLLLFCAVAASCFAIKELIMHYFSVGGT